MKISVFYHHILEAAKQEKCTEEKIFEKIKEAGITAVEVDRDGIDDINKFCAILKRYDFSVSSIYGFYDFSRNEDLEKCEKHIELAKAIKADKIMIVPGFYSEDNVNIREIELKNMIDRTKKLCEIAEKNKFKATIEDFDDEKSPICSVSGMAKFLNEIPSLYVTLDTGNFIIKKEDELRAYEVLKDRIIHVHCKDRIYDEDGSICASPVGEGFIKMEEILCELKKSGYIGKLAIEHFGAENYLDFMMKSANWINKKIGEFTL
jgi:sugar phosphate isomerase/epimerase